MFLAFYLSVKFGSHIGFVETVILFLFVLNKIMYYIFLVKQIKKESVIESSDIGAICWVVLAEIWLVGVPEIF